MSIRKPSERAPIVVTLESIAAGLEGRVATLRRDATRDISRIQEKHRELRNAVTESRVGAMFEVLALDKSETGKAMRDMLLLIREKGSFKTYEAWAHKELIDLESVGLVTTYVSPVALWVDVDTYETDPIEYVLTSIGRGVVDLLVANQIRRT